VVAVTIVQLMRNGPPAPLYCPAVLCFLCAEPITAQEVPSGGRAPDWDGGNAYWRPLPPSDDGNGSYRIDGPVFLHKRCSRKFEELNPGHWLFEELRRFIQQLLENYSCGYPINHPNVEYIAPEPSEWRVGKHDTAKHARYERCTLGYSKGFIDWDEFWAKRKREKERAGQ
jgi:hypothetical protein